MKYSYLFVFIMALIVSACTRPTANKPSSMTIALPNQMKLKAANSAQATTGFLGHVVINVRGPGIDVPISVNFDADKHDSTQPTSLPGSFTLDVPAGSGRLIQILAVYMDTTTKAGDFYYGDVTQELVSGDNNIMIPVTLAGSGIVDGGRIAGRYYLADGSTPTGMLEMRFQPPGGKPPIVIERSSILGGWFSTFALESVPMDLVLIPSEVKMFTGLKLNNFDSTNLTDNKKMKVILPDRYKTYGGGSGGEDRRSETSVIGFFGDGVPTAAKVCFTEAARTYTQMFTDSTKTTAVQWSSSSTKLADVRAIKASSVVACTGGDLAAAYTSVIPFTPALLDNWGGSDAVPGFMGMFQFPTNTTMGSSPVRVSYASGLYNAQFSVLPDSPSLADAIGVFYRSSNSPRDYYGNGGDVPCQQLSQGGLGFVKISSIPLVAGTLVYNVNNPSPADISGNAVMAFCPMKNDVVIGGGFVTDHLDSNSSGVPTPANGFTHYTEFSTVGIGQCHRIQLSLVNESSSGTFYNVTNSTARTFTISGAPAGTGIYADENTCKSSGTTVTSVAINANSLNGEIWYKNTTPTSGSITILSSSFSSPLSRNVSVAFGNPTSPMNLSIHDKNLHMGANECRMVEVFTTDTTWIPSAVSATTTINFAKMNLALSGVTDTSFDFYSDCASATPVGSISFANGDFKKSFAIKTGGSPSSDRVIQLTGVGSFNLYFNVTPVADHMAILINNGNPVYKGSCVPLYLEAQDSSNTKVNSATFNFDVHTYHPSAPGNYGDLKNSCSTSSSAGTLATGSYSSLTFSGTMVQPGVQIEAQSMYLGRINPISFDIKSAPPVDRTGTLQVHLMSDDLSPGAIPSSIMSWPILDTSIIPTVSPALSAMNKSSVPRRDGALFTSSSSVFGSIGGTLATTSEVMLTVKFKLNALPTTGTSADILTLTDGSSWNHTILVDGTSGKLMGTGVWDGPVVSADTWYTVSLSKDGSGNTHGYVNGVDAGAGTGVLGTSNNPNFTYFKVGSAGFNGAVKAVIIDIGAGASSIDLTSPSGEHQYINNRVPDI